MPKSRSSIANMLLSLACRSRRKWSIPPSKQQLRQERCPAAHLSKKTHSHWDWAQRRSVQISLKLTQTFSWILREPRSLKLQFFNSLRLKKAPMRTRKMVKLIITLICVSRMMDLDTQTAYSQPYQRVWVSWRQATSIGQPWSCKVSPRKAGERLKRKSTTLRPSRKRCVSLNSPRKGWKSVSKSRRSRRVSRMPHRVVQCISKEV